MEVEDLTEGCLNRFLDLGAVELRLIRSTVVPHVMFSSVERAHLATPSGPLGRGVPGRHRHHQCAQSAIQGRPHAPIVLE